MSINFFKCYLSQALAENQAASSIYVDRVTNLQGETVTTADFADFGRGILTVNPDGDGNASFPENISFTAVDGTNFIFTGAIRGLDKNGTTDTDLMRYHPVGTPVVISFGVHNLEDLKNYIDDAVAAASFGTNNVVIATAGETITAGQGVYLKNDGKWWKWDADTLGTVAGVQLGIAQGAGTANNAITGGVLRVGLDTHQSALVAGTEYYVSNTAGGISSSAGTNSRKIGVARSSTDLYFDPNYSSASVDGTSIYGVDSGSNDTYVVSVLSALAYSAGLTVNFKANTANTGACTLNVNGLGAKSIKKNPAGTNVDLDDGDIVTGQLVSVIYNGTDFIMTSPSQTKHPVVKVYKNDGTSVFGGSSTTQFDITNPSGTTFRYTYDGNGTNPSFSSANIPVGTTLVVNGQNFAAGNNGTFVVTGSGLNYFEVTNASGVVESNKTLGTGSIKYGYSKPVGLKYIRIRVQGAGAGGGSASASANQQGQGGGAGAYGEKIVNASDLAATETITLGQAGTGGSTSAGSNSTATSFGSIISITAAIGGCRGAGTFAGNTSTSTGGDINIDGQSGQYGGQVSGANSGTGGNSFFGFGGNSTGSGVAQSGRGYGSGGSGGKNTAGEENGGDGAGALIEVTEYYA